MSQIPAASQTVGPFFSIGLDHLCGSSSSEHQDEEMTTTVSGRVLDANHEPICDAMLEIWCADLHGCYQQNSHEGFTRLRTNANGSFHFKTIKPGLVPYDEVRMQAPHLLVLVYMRGLLRHLVTRMYFQGEAANATDPVLQLVPDDRRATLVATPTAPGQLEWTIVMRGEGETAFFAW